MKQLLSLLLIGITTLASAQKPVVAFSLKEKDLIPEGLAYDSIERIFYISSINKKKIVKIVPGYPPVDFITSGQNQIGEVLGMKVDPLRRFLWACSNTGTEQTEKHSYIHVFDLRTGMLIWKTELTAPNEKHLFNDIVITSNGDAYVTDSEFNSIYKLTFKQKAEVLITSEKLTYVNGIALSKDEKQLIVSSFHGLYTIDIADRKLSRLSMATHHVSGLDGVYRYKNSLVGVQNTSFPDAINQYFFSEDRTSLTHAIVLAIDLPDFDIPTTGAIADDWFYFIANSQLRNYEGGKILEEGRLKEVIVMKVKLN
jgi:SMP-30/Gluconolactonase/LRE-like region